MVYHYDDWRQRTYAYAPYWEPLYDPNTYVVEEQHHRGGRMWIFTIIGAILALLLVIALRL